MKKLINLYPAAYAIYDVGEYYGIAVEESFYLVDKQTLETVQSLLRYEKPVIELIENAIPVWFAGDEE